MESSEVSEPVEENKPTEMTGSKNKLEKSEESPSKQLWDLCPSSKGRQRRKNPRYSEFETKELDDEEIDKLSTKDKPTEETPLKTPKKRGRPRKSLQVTTDGDQISAGVTPRTDGSTADGAGQEVNGTPKPKRKYVRTIKEPAAQSETVEQEQEEEEEEEEEVQIGRRGKRGAAKKAMKYLRAIVINETPQGDAQTSAAGPKKERPARQRGRKRKRSDDENSDDDFIPQVEEEEEEEEEDEFKDEENIDLDLEFSLSRRKSKASNHSSSYPGSGGGFQLQAKKTVWDAFHFTKKFREEHQSSWVFPDWIPSAHTWSLVPQSDVEKYLPQEHQSAAFKVSREGIREESTPVPLRRFSSVPANTARWDMHLFTGGPVWAMEWCPTPDGAVASQFLAIATHMKMEEQHLYHKTYAGAGLIQMWDLGQIQYEKRPESQPVLAYGLAQDKGFIWQIKWCPSGGWEAPDSDRKAPLMPRLGLLAVASSSSVVTIYSLPHPRDLLQGHSVTSSDGPPPVFKAEGVVTLKLGSLKSPRLERSGQVLSMDWLNIKPHDIMAIGFYDGTVGLWSLTTSSALLRVRESNGSPTLLPYRCFLAHDRAVRALSFSPASRNLLATSAEDRSMKTWDLNRLHNPVTNTKRYLSNEIHWPLSAAGTMFSQEHAYCPLTSHGVHFYDHQMVSYFPIPRSSTMWSISYSDWLNSLVTSDILGEVIFSLLPHLSGTHYGHKRSIERRIPLYITSMVPLDSPRGENGEKEPEMNQNAAEQTLLKLPSYKEAAQKFYLHLSDINMENLAKVTSRPLWNHMKRTELKEKVDLDDFHLSALHKVRFSPNMASHAWVASAGRAGLVRLHCLRSMSLPEIDAMIQEQRSHCSSPSPPADETL